MSLDGLGLSLFGKFGFEGLLAIGDVVAVAGWVDKGLVVADALAGEFWEQVEELAVGSEEDVARKGFEGSEALRVIGGHLGVFGIVDQVVAGVDVGAADDDGVQGFAAFFNLHGPGGTSLGVTGGFAGG